MIKGWDFVKSKHSKFITLYNSFFPKHPYLEKALFAIGTLFLAQKLYSYIPPLNIGCKFNMQERYGSGSWAVITGGSDGIGKEFALQLAEQGFNICIISRTQSKMEQVCQEIQDKYQVQTQIIQVDFTKGNNAEFYESIKQQIGDRDVSILVNNVGVANHSGNFETMPDDAINDTIVANGMSTVFMTRVLIEKMLQRPKKSAIITISSVLGQYPAPYLAVYSGTKALQDHFSKCLQEEYGSKKIDFLSAAPLGVSTGMLKKHQGRLVITADKCVKGILDDLRRGKNFTWGGYKHKLGVWLRFTGKSQRIVQRTQIGFGKWLRDQAQLGGN